MRLVSPSLPQDKKLCASFQFVMSSPDTIELRILNDRLQTLWCRARRKFIHQETIFIEQYPKYLTIFVWNGIAFE